jgi:hypothetical protein
MLYTNSRVENSRAEMGYSFGMNGEGPKTHSEIQNY